MLELVLDREEREILVDLLETRLADLRMEIGHTSRMDGRERLRKKKGALEKMVAHLRGESAPSAGPANREFKQT